MWGLCCWLAHLDVLGVCCLVLWCNLIVAGVVGVFYVLYLIAVLAILADTYGVGG